MMNKKLLIFFTFLTACFSIQSNQLISFLRTADYGIYLYKSEDNTAHCSIIKTSSREEKATVTATYDFASKKFTNLITEAECDGLPLEQAEKLLESSIGYFNEDPNQLINLVDEILD